MAKVWLTLSVLFLFTGLSMVAGGVYADIQCVSLSEEGETELGIIWCTRRKDSTCVAATPCLGLHQTAICKLVDGEIEGSCFKCNGGGTGSFCVAKQNSVCLVSDQIGGSPVVNCGAANGATCVPDAGGLFGAKCDATVGGSVAGQACARLLQCE